MKPGQKAIGEIPAETSQLARQLYARTNIYLAIGDATDALVEGIDIHLLDPSASLDAASIFRLALVTAFQNAESIPDMEASNATRKRIDWKYALHLPLHHRGIAAQALCAFRQNLYCSLQALKEDHRLIARLVKLGLALRGGQAPVSAEDALLTVCQLSRLHLLYTGMKAALGLLASASPEHFRAGMPPYWYERYKGGRLFPEVLSSRQEIQNEALRLGADMRRLLAMVEEPELASLAGQAEFTRIAGLMNSQFVVVADQIHWRLPGCANCTINTLSELIS